MDRDPRLAALLEHVGLAAQGGDGDRLAEQRAGGGGAERDDERRPDQGQFLLEPPAAGTDLAGIGLFVDAALAPPLELEMLHRIGDVGPLARHAGLGQRLVEQLPGRTDERRAGQILLVARLLADEDQPRIERAFAEHGLGGAFVEIAAGAVHRFRAHRRPAFPDIVADLHRR